jgi:hypothetical protein
MTIPIWYIMWSDQHRRTFSLVGVTWDSVFELWWPYFDKMQYSPDELAAATLRCIGLKPIPKTTAEHLEAIKDGVTEQRVERRKQMSHLRNYEVPGGYVACSICSDSGYVFVPHPADVDQVEWQWLPYKAKGGELRREMAVTCTCRRGHDAYDALAGMMIQRGKAPPMSLTVYETKNPKWRKMLADWREIRRAESEAAWKREAQNGQKSIWVEIVERMIARGRKNGVDSQHDVG